MHEGSFQGTEGSIYTCTWEPDAAPQRLFLLAHGYGEHIRRYDHVAAFLNAAGGVICGCDHLGHGRSDGEPVLIRDFRHLVADFRRMAEAAQSDFPDLPIVLIGHSMGGLLATLYAEQHGGELAGLVLSGPALGNTANAEALLAQPDLPYVPIDPDTLSRDPEVGRAYAEDPLVYHGPFKRPTLQAMVAAGKRAEADAAAITMPLLFLHGEEDALVPLAEARRVVETFPSPDATLCVYPGARHEVFNETNKDEVLGEVGKFAERVTG